MFVYIMANHWPTLYAGVTGNLLRRVEQYKQELIEGFTKRYQLHKLIYYEVIDGQLQAIVREKQIKDMNRDDKLEMIKILNPKFDDLYNKTNIFFISEILNLQLVKPNNLKESNILWISLLK